MIISDISQINRDKSLNKYLLNGTVFDTCVLYVYLFDKYAKLNPDKKHLLSKLNITQRQIDCVNALISNLRIKKVIITPHIFAEFLNRLRSDFKEYKKIKETFIEDLKSFDEIYVEKNPMIEHSNFLDFGNDISLLIATNKQILKFKNSSIMSFDGRFISAHFREQDKNILAFNLDVLQYFF